MTAASDDRHADPLQDAEDVAPDPVVEGAQDAHDVLPEHGTLRGRNHRLGGRSARFPACRAHFRWISLPLRRGRRRSTPGRGLRGPDFTAAGLSPARSTHLDWTHLLYTRIEHRRPTPVSEVFGLDAVSLTWFGAAAVASMLVFYWLEPRSPWYSLWFGVGCAASSAYGWLAGTWPFGVVEGVWAIVAFVRCRQRLRAEGTGH